MEILQEAPRARGPALPEMANRYANAAGNSSIPWKSAGEEAGFPSRITPEAGNEPFCIVFKGRVCWAHDRLREAGAQGCAAMTGPATRRIVHISSLRGFGEQIETFTEPNVGDFSGHHARHALRCEATPVNNGDSA